MVGGRNRKERRIKETHISSVSKVSLPPILFCIDPFLYPCSATRFLVVSIPLSSHLLYSDPAGHWLFCMENGWVWGKVGVDGDGQMVCLGTIRVGTKRYDYFLKIQLNKIKSV